MEGASSYWAWRQHWRASQTQALGREAVKTLELSLPTRASGPAPKLLT